MRHRIFIVDDHAIVRKGYRYLIDPVPDLDVCGEAATAVEALEAIPEACPDLVIADVALKGSSGIELVKDLRARYPNLPVLVVSMHDEALYAERALRAGASGYLMKGGEQGEVVDAAREVLGGGLYLSRKMNRKILLQYSNRHSVQEDSPIERLTDRELEVFEFIGRGLSTGQIGEIMHVSPKTVGTYRRRIKQKLALESGAELVQRAVEWTLTQVPEP